MPIFLNPLSPVPPILNTCYNNEPKVIYRKMYSFDGTTREVFKKHVLEGSIGFPYKRIYKTDYDLLNMMKELKKVSFTIKNGRIKCVPFTIRTLHYPSNELLFLGRPTLLIHPVEDYDKFNVLSDMFQEPVRMRCNIINRPSPLEYFKNNINDIISKCLNDYKTITPHHIRETIYNSSKECTSFKPTNMMYFIKRFKCRSILDPSSGWGDRLLAAIACGVKYTGVDPNEKLHPNYEKMIKMFSGDKKKYRMICSTIEESDLKGVSVDGVFTSPPYFNLENYSSKGNQSANMFRNEDKWIEGFLKPSINKSLSVLKNGGHLGLAFNQKRGDKYIDIIKKYISKKRGMYYLGVIGYANPNVKNPQPIWIWKKSNSKPREIYFNSLKISDSKRTYCRPFHLTDIPQMVKIMSSKNMANIADGRIKGPFEIKNQILKYIEEQYTFYPIILKESKSTIVGFVGYYSGKYLRLPHSMKKRYYLRILVDEKYQRKGYAKEVLACFIKSVRKKMGIKLFSLIKPSNTASIKLHESLGFSKLPRAVKLAGVNHVVLSPPF